MGFAKEHGIWAVLGLILAVAGALYARWGGVMSERLKGLRRKKKEVASQISDAEKSLQEDRERLSEAKQALSETEERHVEENQAAADDPTPGRKSDMDRELGR